MLRTDQCSPRLDDFIVDMGADYTVAKLVCVQRDRFFKGECTDDCPVVVHISIDNVTWENETATAVETKLGGKNWKLTVLMKTDCSKGHKATRFVKIAQKNHIHFRDTQTAVYSWTEAVAACALLDRAGSRLTQAGDAKSSKPHFLFKPSGNGETRHTIVYGTSPQNRVTVFGKNLLRQFLQRGPITHQKLDVCLSIDVFGRMGNNLSQIANAVDFAHKSGIKTIRLPKSPLVKPNSNTSYQGLQMISSDVAVPDGFATLSGYCRHPETLGRPENDQLADRRVIIQNSVFPLMGFENSVEKWRENAKTLSIHIRSGDIFLAKVPHRLYIQPPLSFYKIAIREFRKTHGLERVEIVFEDRVNPCVDSLEKWVIAEGIPCTMQSGSLREDLQTLLNAQHLVFGRGTFGPGVCLLAETVKSVTTFLLADEVFPDRFDGFLDDSAVLNEITDQAGNYIKFGNWKATPDQLELMISYCETNLSFTSSSNSGAN